MEWKIGEIRQVDDEWYQCIREITCINCGFNNKGCLADKHITGDCSGRLDGASVVFKKLEKVGEPYIFSNMAIHNITMQRYKVFVKPIFTNNSIFTTYNTLNETISIEIKNKGNMKMKKVFMNTDDRDYLLDRLDAILHDTHCQQYKDEVCEALSKYIVTRNTPDLKPFDLNSAKAGKPVYTRDGRKARIICFDAKRKDKKSIIALIPSKDYPGFEDLIAYPNDGNYYGGHENDGDLMMLPEKRNGWVNVYKGNLYDTESEAKKAHLEEGYIDTIKIEWRE